jgi:hypothetical protein
MKDKRVLNRDHINTRQRRSRQEKNQDNRLPPASDVVKAVYLARRNRHSKALIHIILFHSIFHSRRFSLAFSIVTRFWRVSTVIASIEATILI